jgi:hypothetical protein
MRANVVRCLLGEGDGRMASYRGHLMLSAPLGAAYGGLVLLNPEWGWAPIVLGAGLCTLGGLLPDLDSDSGVPVRELFGITAAAFSSVLYFPLTKRFPLQPQEALVIAAAVYFLIRYGVSQLFRKMTVHRGMFHSIPAMLISGLVVYLMFPAEDKHGAADLYLRFYLAGGVMLGFLSHLVLDEIYSVDFMGVAIRLNKYAGSAVKFRSSSWLATLTCYGILLGLCYVAWEGTPDWARLRHWMRPAAQAQRGP